MDRKYSSDPNVAMNMNATTTARMRVGLASGRGGASGSGLRRSITVNAPISTSPAVAAARIGGEDRRRAPPGVGSADQREHQQGDGGGGGQRTGQVEPAAGLSCLVRADEWERQGDRGAGQRDVDEKHRRPPEGVREHTAGQHADDQAGGTRAAPHAERPVAAAALGEGAVDDRQGGGKTSAPPSPCSARAASWTAGPAAKPAAAEATAYSASPDTRTRRPPRRSAARPPNSTNPLEAIAQTLMTACSVCAE